MKHPGLVKLEKELASANDDLEFAVDDVAGCQEAVEDLEHRIEKFSAVAPVCLLFGMGVYVDGRAGCVLSF